jgi:hypothetical protein
MEYLQKKDDETADTAWTRMRGKLGSGKHLDETHVLLPQNVPASVASGQTAGEATPEGLSPGEATTDGATDAHGGGNTDGATGGGSIFGGDSSNYVPCESPPTSSLNLLGKLESWGINTGTQLRDLELKVGHLTGAQLQELVKKLPDGMTYELGVEKEEE